MASFDITVSSSASIQKSRRHLRQKMRFQRNQLSKYEQKNSAKKLSINLKKYLSRNQHILASKPIKSIKMGIYLPSDGEIDPRHTTRQMDGHLIKLYFPIIQKNKTLRFGQKTKSKFPRRNKYMIAEPDRHQAIKTQKLDVLLLPLVAASKSCDRLGMGGGFYDRSLAQLSCTGKSPLIIGVAHDFQIVDNLPTQPWDQPLQAIITNQRVIKK